MYMLAIIVSQAIIVAFIFVYEGLHGSRVLGPGNMDVSTDTTAPQ